MTEDDLSNEPPPVLLPCSICSRTFRPDVLERHSKVCEKTASKKRRVFDSFKSRVSGTELEEFLGPAPLPGQPPKRPDKSPVKKAQGRPKWKETHENLIAVLRAARGGATVDPSVMLAPKNSGNEQCPSCGRFFGPRAFDRHVQFCKEKTSRIKLTPSKVSQAQERLEARTKYKAPLSLKPKLTTKEKYSPMLPRKVDSSETCSISSNTKTPSVNSANRVPKQLTGKNNLSNFSRQSPTRSSERQRSMSPKKPVVSSSKISKEVPGKPLAPPKIKETLKDTEDFRPRTGLKMSSHQDKLRNSNRKISDVDGSPKAKQKYCHREKAMRKTYLSSDDENETDSLNSTIESEKIGKPMKKSDLGAKHGMRKGLQNKEKVKSPKLSREGSRSSRRSKAPFPMINDLSVNDESFGIYVAPCPHRSPLRRKSSASRRKPCSRTSTPRIMDQKDIVEAEGIDRPLKMSLELVIPSAKPSSSKIPKPFVKDWDVRKEDDENVKRSLEENSRTNRERTALVNKDKFRKWHNISDVSTNDVLHMTEDFDFMSHLDGLEMEDSEMEEISHSELWELSTVDLLKSEESGECKADVSDPPLNDSNEDEFIVLHVAEPQKLTDDDVDIKLSISEPCFKTNYSDANNKLKAMNPNIFVFDSVPKCIRKKQLYRKRNKVNSVKEVKIIPRILAIRERTFLANDSPRIKRRKLPGKDDLQQSKISNLEEYFFGYIPKVREGYQKFCMKPQANHIQSPEKRRAGEGKKIRGKMNSFQNSDQSQGQTGNIPKHSEPEGLIDTSKKCEYFEVDKDPKDSSSCALFKTEGRPDMNCSSTGESTYVKKQIDKDNRGENCARKKNKAKFARKAEDSKIGAICYSDEEFEELRQKKESSLKHLHSKNSYRPVKIDPSTSVNSTPVTDDVETALIPVIGCSDAGDNGKVSAIDSQEVIKMSPLDNIAEEEELPMPKTRNIEIEDFIIKKPERSSIISRSGNCLAELFPKPPEMLEVKMTESTTVVPLSFVMDSLYDLKDDGNLYGGMLKKKKEKTVGLPQIQLPGNKKKDKTNSMSSLVQTWKNRKEMVEKGTLYQTQMEIKRQRQMNSFEIALLPLVLTQKLAEVAEQLDGSKGKDESYDPFKQAERQMMTLLSWPSTADLKSVNDNSQSPKTPYQPNRTTNLETSPTSAFIKYNSKDEKSPKDVKENANQKRVQKSPPKLNQSGNRKSTEYTPMYSAADDWEEIFEKHFDLNRNEMNEKMTRSVKSALDGLLKNSQNYPTSPESENSPPRKNQSQLSDSSILEDIVYTSTPKRPGSRMSNAADATFEKSSGRKTPTAYRKSSNSSSGRITPPDDFSDSVGKDERGRKSNRNSGVSLSSLSFCSQASDTTLADEEIMRTNLEIIGVGKSTPRTSKRRFARSQSVFDERNKMLFAKTFDSHFSSSDENELLPTINDVQGKNSVLNNPYPKCVPSRFPRSQSVMDGRCKGDGDYSEERNQISSPEGSKNRKAKMSGDSAYSSLNRRSPRSGLQTNLQEDRLSSSGSEHSLPPLSNDHALKPVSLNFENTTSSKSSRKEQPYKMSKFCHECGSKYPIALAKFCCECGVRRLII